MTDKKQHSNIYVIMKIGGKRGPWWGGGVTMMRRSMGGGCMSLWCIKDGRAGRCMVRQRLEADGCVMIAWEGSEGGRLGDGRVHGCGWVMRGRREG